MHQVLYLPGSPRRGYLGDYLPHDVVPGSPSVRLHAGRPQGEGAWLTKTSADGRKHPPRRAPTAASHYGGDRA